MNKLQMNIELNKGSIVTNAEEVKTKLAAIMAEYRTAVFTEESKTVAKAQVAELRKLREAVEKRRKEVKAQIMEPYTDFEKEVRELVAIIDEPIDLISRQIKEMEEERIRKKRAEIRKLYDEIVGGADATEYLPYDAVYDNKWDNAGTSMKKIREAMEVLVAKTAADLGVLLASTSDVKEEAVRIFKESRDLAKAMLHINQYEETKKKALEIAEEKARKEKERRRREEIERARREERKKIAEQERFRREESARLEREAEARRLLDEPAEKPGEPEEDGLPFMLPAARAVFYRIVATPQELEQIEIALDSIGVYYERRDC